MGNGKMENRKWENEEWEIENERINLFFSIYCLIWGIRHFSAVIIVLFGQKKLPSLELKLIDILKDILFVTRLASDSDMIYIGGHIRKVLKKIPVSVSHIITPMNFPIPHSHVRNISTQIFVSLSVTPYENSLINFLLNDCQIPYGLAVRIPGFHPGGPGSTPGMGTDISFYILFPFIFFSSFNSCFYFVHLL